MKCDLFKPAKTPAGLNNPPYAKADLKGADSVLEQQGGLSAEFAGEDAIHPAYCFFEQPVAFRSSLNLTFLPGSNRTFFFRAEHYSAADIGLDIHLEEDSQALIVFHAKGAENSVTKADIRAKLARGAMLTLVEVSLNSGDFSADISVEMNGEGASSSIRVAEVGRRSAKADTRIENICIAPHCIGNIETYSMMLDKAFSRVQGAPMVTAGAYDCENRLEQTAMILSPLARIDSIPLLSIANNRVRASHRASIARLTPEDLFYFHARGIDKTRAEHLLLDGFLEKVLLQLPEKSIGNCIGNNTHHFLERGV